MEQEYDYPEGEEDYPQESNPIEEKQEVNIKADEKKIKEEKFNEAVNSFYKLKQQYENSYDNQKKKIVQNQVLTKKEKRAKLAKIIPLCINCKKSGGTIFTIEYNYLKATCGAETPCKLNIEIGKGTYQNIRDDYFNTIIRLKNLKKLIIDIKLKYLYGTYNEEEALEIFDNYTKDFNAINEYLDYLDSEYDVIIDNVMNKPKIRDLEYKLQTELDYMKTNFLDKFKEERNIQYIKDYMDYIKNVIEPINNQLMNLKYSLNEVEYDSDSNVYTLNQNTYKLSELITFDSRKGDNIVIRYDK